MVKTLQELNHEFMDSYIFKDKAATPDILPRKSIMDELSGPSDDSYANAVPKKSSISKPLWKDLLFLFLRIALILLAFVLLFTLVFGIARYAEPSMSPALKDGDLVIYHRYRAIGYLPQDTIMLEFNGQLHARRVVATAGDVVDITEDGLVINGAVQQETDIHQETERYADGVDFPLTVPEGHVFVLGDSRIGATDSRIYGSVNVDDTLGKVIAVIRRRNI